MQLVQAQPLMSARFVMKNSMGRKCRGWSHLYFLLKTVVMSFEQLFLTCLSWVNQSITFQHIELLHVSKGVLNVASKFVKDFELLFVELHLFVRQNLVYYLYITFNKLINILFFKQNTSCFNIQYLPNCIHRHAPRWSRVPCGK